MSDPRAWQSAQNILCVRLDSIGDVLMMTPALRAIRESGPGRRITLLTSAAGGQVAPLIPEIDETMIYNPPWMKASAPPQDSRPDLEMIERLRGRGFDAAVIFTTFSQSPLPAALLTYLADIPLRLAHCRENPYHLLSDWAPETDRFGDPAIRHEVRRQLDLVASVGWVTVDERLLLRVSERARADVSQKLESLGVDRGRPWLVLHPGASAPSRRYPPERFAQAADRLSSARGMQIVLTGTEAEIPLVEAVRRGMDAPSFSLAGELDLEELAALIGMAPLAITNNSGPAHIAAALSTPAVVLYALTNPQHTPWGAPHRLLFHDVPCRLCYKSVCPMEHYDCLRRVPPDAVVRAALELLGDQERGRAEVGLAGQLTGD